ncbi:hypothetical protein Q5752_004193 [Cryptotrichosporon argae]
MARDPYHDVKREVETNLNAVHALLSSYDRIASTSASASSASSSPTLVEARDELRGTLGLLEADLEDLDECVRAVEQSGARWGIEPGEVGRRRQFLNRIRAEVKELRAKVFQGSTRKADKVTGYRDDPDADLEAGDGNDAAEAERWERQEQQMLIRQQDDTLGLISGTLHTLASQAGLIGHEVVEQSEMLDDLGNRVDSTQTRLGKVTRTLNDFIRRNEDTRSSWCIGILIVILIILLMLVIIT